LKHSLPADHKATFLNADPKGFAYLVPAQARSNPKVILSLSLSSFVAPAGASPHLGAYEDFILRSKSLGPTTTRMSPSDLWAIAKKLKKEPEEFLHLSSSTRKGTAADLFWTSGGVLLLQDFFSDEDQKKFCSSRVEEQKKKKKKKKKEKMSFVFRGSRGDLESGLQNFMTARRNVRFHGAGRALNANPMALLMTVLLLFMIVNSHQMSPNFLEWECSSWHQASVYMQCVIDYMLRHMLPLLQPLQED
jgi:hypothetical protein